MVPDWASLRQVSWQERTALILCDIHDNKTHALVSVAPRSVLRKQIDAANALGYPTIYAASELEYYQYETTYREAHARNYQQKLLKPSGDYFEDYHILQTSREEKYTSVFRKHLKASGIPVRHTHNFFSFLFFLCFFFLPSFVLPSLGRPLLICVPHLH